MLPPPLPPGLVWVTQGPAERSSTLHVVDFAGTATSAPMRYSVNALACTPSGALLALATERDGARLPDAPHLVRLSAAGAVADLGPAPGRESLVTGYGAALATGPDGAVDLLVSAGDELRTVRVFPGPPHQLPPRALPGLPYQGDWAADPRTGDLVTVVAVDGVARLVRLPRGAAAAGSVPVPALPGRSAYGGIAVLGNGDVAVLFNAAQGPGAGPGTGRAPMTGALYRIPAGHPERATLLTDIGPVTSTDAATCPVHPPASPSASPTFTARSTAAPSPPRIVRSRAVRAPSPEPSPVVTSPSPSHKGRIPEPPALAAAETKHRVGARYIPVMGGLMLAAVTVTRLLRRNRAGR